MPTDDDDRRRPDGGTDLLDRTATKPRPKRPSMYKVLLHNDDYTPVELVIHVLRKVFGMDEAKAFQVMETAHTTGNCLCGVFTLEIAETLVLRAKDLARAHDFALQFTMEKD